MSLLLGLLFCLLFILPQQFFTSSCFKLPTRYKNGSAYYFLSEISFAFWKLVINMGSIMTWSCCVLSRRLYIPQKGVCIQLQHMSWATHQLKPLCILIISHRWWLMNSQYGRANLSAVTSWKLGTASLNLIANIIIQKIELQSRLHVLSATRACHWDL